MVFTCLAAVSTSLSPGRQLTQVLRAWETALATWASRVWLSGLLGLLTAFFASMIKLADLSITSMAQARMFSCQSLSPVVAATPRAASIITSKALAVSRAAVPV
ncbi:hypothetical protein NP493_327g01001 [Ridgeia piscesae]|uniref:Uncharacterized protein n=1 Tax=Ridgeia piscesae TaxID=27915 RepID=A0AAD9L4Z7_RIDPI|nr:hypothetical protein NP493_327g01001 [Ridgeia piscesae]